MNLERLKGHLLMGDFILYLQFRSLQIHHLNGFLELVTLNLLLAYLIQVRTQNIDEPLFLLDQSRAEEIDVLFLIL